MSAPVASPGASTPEVLESIRDLRRAGREAAVATVVDVEGRAYRRPGAKMVVEPDGGGAGLVTAGCLEDEVVALAEEVLAAGEARLETYDLRADGGAEGDSDVWGLGVGCDGVVDVLLEPVDARFDPLAAAVDAGEPVARAAGLDGDVPLGATAYYRDGRLERDDAFPGWLAEALAEPAAALLEEGGADAVSVETAEGAATAFVEGIRPPPRLLVFGTGHDARPVVDLARRVGFRVTVVGYRGAADLEARFPEATAHVSTTPGRLREAVDLEGAYAVVMTHNLVDDRLTAAELLAAGVPYVGLMGPRERSEEVLEGIEREDGISAADLEAVYAPVGLDLGEGSPYGIATSVVAEVCCVREGREPGHLADREGPIHDRTAVDRLE